MGLRVRGVIASMKPSRCIIALLLAWATMSQAQILKQDSCKTQQNQRLHWALRTNLLYDAVLIPNVGAEYAFGERYSVAANIMYTWLKNDSRHRYWRVFSTDVEARYWLGSEEKCHQLSGHHIGIYGAIYRYDFEFGGKGEMGNFNYGGGISYGYSLPIGKVLNLDFSLGIGYIGGKYKEYKPIDTHYVWQGDWNRNFFGPTKAEVTLVWHINKNKKGWER